MNLQEKIKINQRKQARFRKAEKLLRAVRLRIFDYEDYDTQHGTHKEAKSHRIITRCLKILAPLFEAQRHAAQVRKLNRTPSAFEPGLNHNHA